MARSALKLIENSVRPPTGSVYHYTGSEALLAMIERRTLRASEASGMNDLAEVRQGWAVISRVLASMPRDDVVDMLIAYAQSPTQDPYEVFILSAASDGDDANQWRLYGNQGRGYAIELDPTMQVGVVSSSDHWPYRTSAIMGAFVADVTDVGVWLHVMYSDLEVERALVELASSVRAQRRVINTTAKDADDAADRWEELKVDASGALASIAHLVKSQGFSGEREVRLVSSFVRLGDHVHYRAGAYGIVGFVNLATLPSGHTNFRVIRKPTTASDLDVLPIRSVRLGPLASVEQINTLQVLLDRNGLSGVAVERSTVPLR